MLKKVFAASIITASSLLGAINIAGIESMEGSSLFRDKVFNQEVKLPEGCVPLGVIFDLIGKQTNYTVRNQTNLDEKAPVCNMNQFKIAGHALEAITKDSNKIFFTNDENRDYDSYIYIAYGDSYTAVFPTYWDTSKSAKILKDKFPFLRWTFYGNVVKVEGSKADIEKAVPKIMELRDFAVRETSARVTVSKLNINPEAKLEHDINFNRVNIIQRMSQQEKARIYNVLVRHGNQVHVNEVPVAIVFDFQKNVVRFGEKEVNFDALRGLAFMYQDYMVTIDVGGLFDNSLIGH